MAKFFKDEKKSHILRLLFLSFFITLIFISVVFFCPLQSFASGADFSVSYDTLKCGTPINFTVNLTAPSDGSSYKYYLNYVSGYSDGVKEYVADPSRLPGYQESNSFDFTFYASGNYEMRFYVMETTASGSINFVNKTITFTIDDPSYPSVETLADRIVAKCLSEGCTTDYEKALWLHDYIISNMRYDYSYVYCGSEGALARGLGICEAYHRGYCMLLKRAGIEYGRVENRTKLYHVWTAVKMEGNWYQVDCTWDDQDGHSGLTPYEEHLYFGANEAIMNGRSTPNTIVGDTGAFSDSLSCNYFIKSGKVHEYSDIYKEEIQTHISNGDEFFTLDITNGFRDDYYYNTNNAIFHPVAYQLSKEKWTTPKGQTVTVSVTYDSLKLTVNVNYPEAEPDTSLSLTIPSGYNDSTVYVDGVAFTGTVSESLIKIDLTDTASLTAVMYKYNASNVPVGMYVWRLSWDGYTWHATALSGLTDLLSYHGFSIRCSGNSGIRFKSGISTLTKQALRTCGIDGYKLVEIGSIYMSDSNRTSYPFIKGGNKVSSPGRAYYSSNGSITDSVFETVSGRDRFANVLTGLPEARYATVLAFRSYAILKDEAGTEITVYGPIVSRSIYTVAKQIIARGDFAEGTAGYNYLQNIIHTVEGQ